MTNPGPAFPPQRGAWARNGFRVVKGAADALSRPPLTRRSRCGSRDIATDDLARLAIVDLNPVLAVLVRKYPLPVGVGAIGYVQSEAAGERVMASLERLLTKRLRLKMNHEKSAVARPWNR